LAFPAGDAIVPPWSPPAGNLHHPDLFVQQPRFSPRPGLIPDAAGGSTFPPGIVTVRPNDPVAARSILVLGREELSHSARYSITSVYPAPI
jgi:hypothetical protein